jgi:hypothetical protein
MEIIEFTSAFYKMYNPVAGDTIVDEECDDDAESLIGYWIDEVFEEPIMNNQVFLTAWEEYSVKYRDEHDDESPDYDALGVFLREYENPAWKVIEITSYGMACGPVSHTVWMVVDKDTVVEDVEFVEKGAEETEEVHDVEWYEKKCLDRTLRALFSSRPGKTTGEAGK